LQVVDDDLVAAVGTERGLHRRRDRPAGVDVAKDGAIFRVVAVGLGGQVSILARLDVQADRVIGGAEDSLVVSSLKQASVWRVGNI